MLRKGFERVFKIQQRDEEAFVIVNKEGHQVDAIPEFISLSFNKVS